MASLYEQLSRKLEQDPRLTKRGGARYDLGLLLFNSRDSLFELWKAADRFTATGEEAALEQLRAAVEKLRPWLGEPATR